MKVIFCKFFDFFTQPQKKGGREDGRPAEKARQIGQEVAQLEDGPAQQQEIARRAAQDGGDVEDAHSAVPHRHGIDEKGRGDRDPKQQVEEAPQQGQAHPDPKHAEQVVQHAHRRPQGQRAGQGEGLGGDGDLHPSQRKRRERKPPLSRGVSS